MFQHRPFLLSAWLTGATMQAQKNKKQTVFSQKLTVQGGNRQMAKKKNYDELAGRVVELVGGKSNIVNYTHCVTRLRFNVADKSNVQKDVIAKIPGVLGTQWQGDQLQIIIGQNVGDAYDLILKKNDLGDLSGNPGQGNASKEKKNPVTVVLDGIAGSVVPILPALIGGGMIKIILLLLTLTGILTEQSGTYITLSFVADAAFYFLPVFVGCTAAEKFGANKALGMMLGAILISPTFISMVEGGTVVTLFGLPVYTGSYSSSIFPIILTMAVTAPVEKFIAKHVPDILRSLLEPLLTLLIMAPLMLLVLAPIGSVIGNYLAAGIMWLYNTTGFLAVGIMSCVLPLLVLTGMHHGFTPYLVQAFADYGYEPIIVACNIISNINQGAACLGVSVKAKDQDLKTTAASCGVTAILGGVTEPALFGVNFKYRTPLYASMIGGFVGGIIAGIGRSYAYVLPGSWGVLSLPAFIGKSARGVLFMIIAMAVSIAVTFIMTLILFKSPEATDTEADNTDAGSAADIPDAEDIPAGTEEVIDCPIPGTVRPLSEIPDQTFASGVLGQGIAVEPSEGKVYAPFDGRCDLVFETKHALSLTSDKGTELLIHVGLETVSLAGKPFTAHVKNGDRITKGQLLLTFDREAIRKAGCKTISAVVVANSDECSKIETEGNSIKVMK